MYIDFADCSRWKPLKLLAIKAATPSTTQLDRYPRVRSSILKPSWVAKTSSNRFHTRCNIADTPTRHQGRELITYPLPLLSGHANDSRTSSSHCPFHTFFRSLFCRLFYVWRYPFTQTHGRYSFIGLYHSMWFQAL